MTDYYISKSGTSGGDGSIGDPVQTVAQALALGATLGDTVVFRAGTYDTELDNSGTSTYHLKWPAGKACNIKGYAGETVNFQSDNSVGYLVGYVSQNNSSGSDATVTIENINFVQVAEGSGCTAFLRLDSGTSTTNQFNWVVKDCTFTQTESQHGLTVGCIFSNSTPTVGQHHTIQNCTFNISHEHIFQLTNFVDYLMFRDNTVTITQPADATDNQVDRLFFVSGQNAVSRITIANIINNDITVTLDDRNDAEQIFQFDYVNNVNFLGNHITTHKHPSQSSIGGTLGDVVRFYQAGTNNSAGNTHREFKTIKISGNHILRNDVRGDTFDFNGSGGSEAHAASSVTCTYNTVICTDPLQRTNDDSSYLIRNVTTGQCNDWIIKYNKASNSQDGVYLREGGAGTLSISYNIFENIGEDAATNAYDPQVIRTRNIGSASHRTEIKGNVFDFVQKGRGVSATDSGEDAHCDIIDNTFITRTFTAGTAEERMRYFHSASGTGSQHTISGNRYMSSSNLNSTILANHNGTTLNTDADISTVDTTATFTNMSSKLTTNIDKNGGFMTKTLGL